MARSLTVMRAIEKPKPNPSRFLVAHAIYDSLREIGVDPPWDALGNGIGVDKWVEAAEAALAVMVKADSIPNWRDIQARVEDLCDEAGSLRRKIEDLER